MQEIEQELRELFENAHTPYFNYPVAAIVIVKDGRRFYGVNVETSSPAAGICAERNALYSAIAAGYTKGDIKEVHIMSKQDDECFPCFICRQALNDFCDKDVKVISHQSGSRTIVHTIEELCPYPFGEDNLN